MTQKAWIPSLLRPVAALWADRVERRHSPGMAAIVTADAVLQARFTAMNGRVVELDNYPPLGLFREVRETPPGPPTLVYVGSVSAVRGFFDMVEVLRRVRIELPDARLVIHGRATEDVVPHLAEVAGDMGTDALELRGAISYGDIAGALAEAHVGLSLLRPHPKYEKNVSMKVFDYMAAGLPYVASDFRPLRDATGGVGGTLVAPGDTAAAAEAVLTMLRDTEGARRAGREGRSLVESRLNWERMEPQLFGLYEELLSEPGGRASIRR